MPADASCIQIDQDLIDELEHTPQCQALFDKVLERSTSECLLTDLSSLSDFTGSGAHGLNVGKFNSYGAYARAWDRWALERIEQEFGVRLECTTLPLVQIVARLQDASSRPTLN